MERAGREAVRPEVDRLADAWDGWLRLDRADEFRLGTLREDGRTDCRRSSGYLDMALPRFCKFNSIIDYFSPRCKTCRKIKILEN